MSSISAGTSVGTALVQTGDTTGDLVLKTGSSATTAVTIAGSNQAVTLAQPLGVASGGTGLTTVGTNGQVLQSNGTSLQWGTVAAGVTNFTASGSITAGVPVMLNNDGTVRTLFSQTGTNGSRVAVNSVNSQSPSVAYDTVNNRAVFCYSRFNGSVYQLYAVVASLSGTTFTFGSETLVDSNNTDANTIVYDPVSQKVVIVYRRSSAPVAPYAVVGTVSGTSISFGSPVAVHGSAVVASGLYPAVVESGKIVVSFTQSSDSVSYSIVGTISGTSISFGTAVAMGGVSDFNGTVCAGVGNNKVVYTYSDGGNFSRVIVGTVSGTSISFGTPVVIRSQSAYGYYCISKTDTEKFILGFMNSNGSVLVYAGVVNGTVPIASPVGTGVGTLTDNASSLAYIPALGTAYLSYATTNIQNYRAIILKGAGGAAVATVSAFSGASNFNGSASALTVSNDGTLVMAVNNSSGHLLAIAVTTPTASNYPLLIGTANSSATNGQTVPVTTFGGTATNQTGLITNTVYYVNSSGLTTSSTDALLLGKSLSSTSILITGGGS